MLELSESNIHLNATATNMASSGTRPKAATAVGFLSVIGAAVHPIDEIGRAHV